MDYNAFSPDSPTQALNNQLTLQLGRARNQALAINNDTAQQDLLAKRRAMGISLFNGVMNEQDPQKQQEMIGKIVPMFNRYVTDMQLDPNATDINTVKTLVASQVPYKDQMTLNMEQQKIDQGKYTPVKDLYGNVTGFVDTKRGTVLENPMSGPSNGLPPMDEQGNALTGDAYIAKLPPTQASMVKAIGEGRMAPLSGMALTHGPGLKIMQDVENAYPGFNANAFKTLAEFDRGKLGNTVRSLNVANDHLDTLQQYASALNNGDVKLINSMSNSFKSQFGQTAPTNFNAAKQIVADEVVKAVVGSGGSLADREEAARTISAANSPEQLLGVIQTYKSLMRGQLEGLRQQYENNTGRTDFGNRLSKRTRDEIMGEAQGAQAAPAIAVPDSAIAYLRANPRLASQFEQKYGVKAADYLK